MMDDSISRNAAVETVDFECGEWRGLAGTIVNGLKNLPAANRWIPCKERLPEYGKTVLITNAKGNVSYGRFRGVEFWKEDGDSCWTWKKNTIEHVLAWMPLPEPYKEEEGEL